MLVMGDFGLFIRNGSILSVMRKHLSIGSQERNALVAGNIASGRKAGVERNYQVIMFKL